MLSQQTFQWTDLFKKKKARKVPTESKTKKKYSNSFAYHICQLWLECMNDAASWYPIAFFQQRKYLVSGQIHLANHTHMKYVEGNGPQKHYYLPSETVEMPFIKSSAYMLNSVGDLMIMTNKAICKHLQHVRLIFFHLLCMYVSVISSLCLQE